MRFTRRLGPFLWLLLVLAGGTILVFKHNELLDWFAARSYEPTAAVQTLTTNTTMTPYATRLFYANRPAIEAKQTFNTHCTDPSEQVAVLGCFVGNRRGIYLYDVTDERLNGIKEVTAAHEMLHQAYQRLRGSEKTRINGLLQEYHDLRASQQLKDKIASYSQTEPDHLQNEMHSIFGTEAADLPPELEEYYRQYFSNRAQLLGYYQKYQSEFDQRLSQIASYDDQLADLKPRIEANKADLHAQEEVLNSRRSQLDAYLAANNIAAYNAGVPSFNSLVAAYRADLKQTNNMVAQYNDILGKRNELAVQERQLEAAIDSSSVPTAPKQ